jgi:hypothetical protein
MWTIVLQGIRGIGDFHPKNIVLDECKLPVLIDFESASVPGRHNRFKKAHYDFQMQTNCDSVVLQILLLFVPLEAVRFVMLGHADCLMANKNKILEISQLT